jgi:hypothetical protein
VSGLCEETEWPDVIVDGSGGGELVASVLEGRWQRK